MTKRNSKKSSIFFLVSSVFIFIYTLLQGLYSPLITFGSESAPWYKECMVGMEVGPTGAQFGSDPEDVGYAADFSGTDIVEAMIEAHSEYIVIWAKDSEYAYYSSKVAPKCPGLGERDVLRETVEAAKPHGLPVIAYCVVQGNGYPLRRHTEYKMKDANGNPIDRICFNSGYLEHAKAVVAEMLEYGIDGLHIDMLDQGFGPPYGCWCETCQKLFEAEYGHSMPAGVTWDEKWDWMLEFRYNTSQRFEKKLYQSIKSIDPEVTVDFNYHGYPPFSWEVGQRPVQHAVNADFVTGETGVWGFSALGVGLTAEFLAASTPGNMFQIAMQRGVRMYHDQTTRPLNDLRWELFTLLAHGSKVTLVDKTPYDGSLDPVAYERFGKLFREALGKKGHFGQEVVQDVGIYYSNRSRDWYGKENPSHYQQSFTGAHAALVYEHIPFGIVLDENVSLDRLKRFPVILLANTAILSEEETALFQQYVKEGGNILATGCTGLYDWMGNQRDESAIAELVGGQLVEVLPSIDNHVRFSETAPEYADFYNGIPIDWAFMVKGPAAAFQKTSAQAVGQLMRPDRTVRQKKGLEGTDWPMSADQPVGPAVLIHSYGEGKVVYLPCSPDGAVASEHAMTEDRLLLRNAVRYLYPHPRVEIEAPRNIETVITDDPDERFVRIHFLGYLTPPNHTPAKNRPYVLPALIEEPPLFRAEVRCAMPIYAHEALNPETIFLNKTKTGFEVQIQDVHEVVLLRY